MEMDNDKTKRIKSLKIIISEAIMVITVILTVVILALVVSGYWLNSDFEVERQGLLQVSSVPTGANVEIDGGSSWLQRTNTSKTLSSGEHSVTLSKEGYDTWSRTVNIREGLLYRLHYPRLFLTERTPESVLDTKDTIFATVSPDRDTLLLANSTTKWQLISLNDEKLKSQPIDISTIFSSSTLPESSTVGTFDGQIISADWAKDNAHILFKVKKDDTMEWVILNLDHVKDSINLSQKFATNFDDIQIVNNSASTLLALQGQNLRRIDTSSEQISAILAEKVVSLDHFENEVLFVAEQAAESDVKYTLNLLDLGNGKTDELSQLDFPAQVTLSKFYDDKYITILHDASVSLYQKSDFTKIEDFTLSFNPTKIKVGHNGEFITMHDGAHIATLDMEAIAVTEWTTDSADFGWLDNDMIFAVSTENLLYVYDFDGFNRRELAHDASLNFPATVTDDKWLYYFSGDSLIREVVAK